MSRRTSRRNKQADIQPASDGNLALRRAFLFDPEDEEMPTNPLYSGRLTLLPQPEPEVDEGEADSFSQPVMNTTDWLRLREHDAMLTGKLPEEALDDMVHPSGMGQHATAPRIVPTVGARVRTGVRRSTLLVLLATAVGGALAGGGYLLGTSQWLTNVTAPAPVASAPKALAPAAPAPARPAGTQPQSNKPAQSQPAQQAASAAPQAPAPAASSQGGAMDDQLGTVGAPAPAASGYSIQRDWGLEQYRQGNYDKAIDLLEQYVMINGEDAQAYQQLGLSYLAVTGREHSLEDAELAFRTATSLQPTWAAPYQGLAESFLRRNLYDQAIAPAEKATQLAPAQAAAWLTLARAYDGAGRRADATHAYSQAAQLSPPPLSPNSP